MRKIIVALGIILLVAIFPYSVASAGSINSYEQEVISFAQGTFEYKGVYYKVDPYYINMLREYLAADDIDLTAEQRNKVFRIYRDYMETGVQGGYLIPVSGATPVDTGAGPGGNTGGNPGGSPNQGNPDGSNGTGNNTGNPDIVAPDKTDNSAGGGNTGKPDSSVSPENTDNNENADNVADTNPVSEMENPSVPTEQTGNVGLEEASEENSNAEGIKQEANPVNPGSGDKGRDTGENAPAENASNSGKTTPSEQDSKPVAGNSRQDNQSNDSSTADADASASDNEPSKGDFLLELLDLILGVERNTESEQAIEDKPANVGNEEPAVTKEESVKKPVIVKQNKAVSNNTDIIDNIINKGNNLKITYIVLLALGLLLLSGIIITLKLSNVRKKDE